MENIPKKFEVYDEFSGNSWVFEKKGKDSYKWEYIQKDSCDEPRVGYNTSFQVAAMLKMYKITKIYEEEKPVTRKYPDKFTLKALRGGVDYEYVYEASSGRYKTIYNGSPYYNDENHFDYWIEKGTHEMIPAECNGVDANGDPFHFTPDMLKPFMRVVTSAGNYIVINPYPDGKPCMHSGAGHTPWYEPSTSDKFETPYIVDEVYEAPISCMGLNPKELGKLIWKRQEVKSVDESITKRLEWLQVHIDAVKENMTSVKENMESLQAEYDELKQAVK